MTRLRLLKTLALTTAVALALQSCEKPAAPKVEAKAPFSIVEKSIPEMQAAMADGRTTSRAIVSEYLMRMGLYEDKLNAAVSVNANALAQADALDKERAAGKVRGPLHGIPVALKDNIMTKDDMPTSGGMLAFKHYMAPYDATLVANLKAAGAIIIAKSTMSELAGWYGGGTRPGGYNGAAGQSYNPYDPRANEDGTPVLAVAGSSSGVGVAANLWAANVGTSTGGSIEGPSNANMLVGIRPSTGRISRYGIVPLSLDQDTAGPMAKNVSDAAIMLGAMEGAAVDPNDPRTSECTPPANRDYTVFLKADALKGARIGVARDYMGADPDVDWVIESALKAIEKAGGTVVEVRLPKWYLDSATQVVFTLYPAEFKAQIADYLKTTGPKYPKNLDQLIERAEAYNDLRPDGVGPNLSRWQYFKNVEAKSVPLDGPVYNAMLNHYIPMTRALLDATFAKDKLDAIVYPTTTVRPETIVAPPAPPLGSVKSPRSLGNLSGYPDLIVPAGFTTDDLPVTISFFGPAFSEPKLLALGYSFEQATKAIRRPVNTPALPGAKIEVPEK